MRINDLAHACNRVARWALALSFAASIAACGGGGSDAPKPASQCISGVIKVQLFGDSTMLGSGATDPAWTPSALLQSALDARFGVGKTQVLNYARGGTTTADALAGARDMAVWPADVKGDIVVANWGVNDSAIPMPLEAYRTNLRKLVASGVTMLETPNPIVPGSGLGDEAYAQVMREVAAESGIPVADAQAYVLSVPNWNVLYSDGYHHPADALYRMISANVLVPAVAKQVQAMRCS